MTSSQSPYPIALIICLFLNPLVGIGIELYSIVLPSIPMAFSIQASHARLTLSLYCIGFALGHSLIGTLSDCWARKPVLLIMLGTLGIVSLIPLFNQNIWLLYGVRCVQGMVTAGPAILARSIIADSYTGSQQIKHLSKLSIAWGSGMVMILFMGNTLARHLGWQASFMVTSAYAWVLMLVVACFLRETLAQPQPAKLSAIWMTYRQLFSSPTFMRCALLCATAISQHIIFSTLAPFLIQSAMGYSANTYSYCLIGICLVWSLGGLCHGTLLYAVKLKRLQLGILLLMGGCTLGMGWQAYTLPMTLYTFMIPALGCELLASILFTASMTNAMGRTPRSYGVTSALLGTITYLGSGLTSSAASHLSAHSQAEYAWLMGAISLAGGCIYHLTKRLDSAPATVPN